MPYKNATDPTLPDYVKSMSDAKRRRWVGAFNTAFKQHGDEGTAFRVANGLTKTKGVQEEMKAKVEDALAGIEFAADALSLDDDEAPERKDYDDGAVMVYEEPKPYGGATSYAEVQEVLKAQKTQTAVSDLSYIFQCIYQNIMGKKEDEMTPAQKGDAVIAAAKEFATLMGSPLTASAKVGFGETKGKSLIERFKEWAGIGEKEGGYGSAFWSFVDNNGEWRWLSAYSNNFEDRDGETFTEVAHKDFVRAAYKLNRLPELWVWHTPGSRIGFCDFLDVSDGFIVASGKFDEPEMGPKLAAKADELGVSHGYRYPADMKQDGVIHRYFDFEISVLPQRRASNPHMPLDKALKEGSKMTFEKRRDLVDVLGEEKVVALESALGDKKEELMTQGIDWKAIKEALAEPAVAAVSATQVTPAVEVVATVATPATPATPVVAAVPATPTTPVTPVVEAATPATLATTEDDDELKKRVAATEETLGVLVEATKEIVTSIKALKRDKDDIIGEAMSPRRPAPLEPEQRPSQSDATLLAEDKAAKLREELKIEGDEKESTNPAYKYVRPLVHVGQ